MIKQNKTIILRDSLALVPSNFKTSPACCLRPALLLGVLLQSLQPWPLAQCRHLVWLSSHRRTLSNGLFSLHQKRRPPFLLFTSERLNPDSWPLPLRTPSQRLRIWQIPWLSGVEVIAQFWSCASGLSGPPGPPVGSSGGTRAGQCSWQPPSSSPWHCPPTRSRSGSRGWGGAPVETDPGCCRSEGKTSTLWSAPSSKTWGRKEPSKRRFIDDDFLLFNRCKLSHICSDF